MKRWLQWALILLSFVMFGVIVWYAGPEPWRQLLLADRRILLLAFCAKGLLVAQAASGCFLTQSIQGNAAPTWRCAFTT
ncbi:MAG: hypothetical protein H6669_14370 [Ardenticatenaceae bacterium]|nr:hypothetical protein [Ardenticatenaceae bacterium]